MQLDLEVKKELEQTFIFKSLLGQGSFGIVYECEDKRDNQIYAVKIISKSNVKKSKMQCLREEARLLSSIDHPNIVKVYEFVQTNIFIFLRMQIIRNGTLQKLIHDRWSSGKKFSDEEMAAIIGSIFRSLHYIHSINIMHRDIKPQNILIPCYEDLSKLKMADFGLSTKLDFFYPKTATMKCGTMLYMAPQILNNLSYTKSVDIWSCSIIMFILAQGKHPFFQQKMTTEDFKRKIKTVVFPPLSNALAQDFIAKISKSEANQRYTTQQALKHPWLTRNFDDQIPQSLHESFAGFQKSHTISNIFKLLLTVKSSCQSQTMTIPESYRTKINQQSEYFLSLNLKKLRSVKLQKEQSTISDSGKSSTPSKQDQKQKEEQQKNYDQNAPALAKLNAIFDTLLGGKSRNKEKRKTENISSAAKERIQYFESPPKHLLFKEKLQGQIQKLVGQYKSQITVKLMSDPNIVRKILPTNKRRATEKYPFQKEEFRVSIQSSSTNSSTFKIRHRKKAGAALRLYD